MTLSRKAYKLYDTLRMAFQASPASAALYAMLSIIQAIMPTAAMALATANFVDTATAILQGKRPHNDIYLPLIVLLALLGVFTTVGAVSQLWFAPG